MDQERFDHIARTLGCTGSRRGVVGGLLAGLVGAGIARVTDAAAKGKGQGKSKTKGKGKGRNKNQGRVSAQAACTVEERAVCEGLDACCSTLEGQGCITVATQNTTGQDGSGGPCGDPGAVCGFCAPGTRCTTVANGDAEAEQQCICDGFSCPNGCCSNGTGNPGVCRINGTGVCGTGGDTCVECTSGCCDLGGNCEPGTEDDECGTGGGICASCGPGGSCVNQSCNTCNPSVCDGCCDNGVCRPGTSNNACGNFGNACVECPDGQRCLQSDFGNICAFGGCNQTTCPDGCCDGDVCRLGTNDSRCGTGGAACVECGFRQECENQVCVDIVCDATTCPDGCCDVDGFCVSGNRDFECGSGGAACVECGPGQECKNQICVDIPCNATTCPDGCCDANGICRNGDSNNSCGVRGSTCVACGGNQQCVNGVCQTIVCNADSCPNGCCDANGVCRNGDSNNSCGVGGAACAACGANEECVNGICRDIPCNASTCPNGCCDTSGTCRAGDTIQACGDGGAACQACTGANPTCVNGTCRSNPDPVCPTGFEECGNICVDLGTDKQNCGGCGIVCPGCGRRKRPLCEGGNCSCRRKGGRRGKRRR